MIYYNTTEPLFDQSAEYKEHAMSSPSSSPMLAGIVAVITGAASGIGKATVDVFQREGATVVGIDLHGSDFDVDVSNSGDVNRVVDEVHDKYGRIDALVNVAGVGPSGGLVADITDVGYLRTMGTNGSGPFFMMRAVIPHMVADGGGSIVSVSSLGSVMPIPGFGDYSASKAVVDALTRSVATEYGSAGIRANAVQPGTIRTPLTKPFLAGDTTAERQMAERHALHRIGEPGEVAEVLAFLSSSRASFVTGVSMPVDGGWRAGIPVPMKDDD